MTTWLTAVAATLNADGGWSGYTPRNIISSSVISNAGLAYVRVTFKSGVAGGMVVSNAYIGQKADTGDVYDFKSTPVELLFSGVSGFSIGANTSIVSDSAAFSIPSGKDIIVSLYISSGYARVNNSVTGWSNYYSSGNSAGTVNASGYSSLGGYSVGVSLIEAGYEDAGGSGLLIYY